MGAAAAAAVRERGRAFPPHRSQRRAEDELYRFIQFTFAYNATGQPAFSLPNGFTKSGLPIGLQIIGRPTDELGIIALAA